MAIAGSVEIELAVTGEGKYSATVKNAGQVLRQFQSTAESTSKSVKRLEEAQFALGTRFRNLVLTLGNLRFAAMDVYDVFLRLPKSILDSAGELERTQQLLKGLSKEMTDFRKTQEAQGDFNFITGLSLKAPFEIATLADSFVKLKATGITPLQGSMQALVDSVAKFGGTGEQFKRASIAIQQMAGKGVVSMEELRQQLGEAIPTAMQDMADGMGLSMAELTKKVSSGTVEARSAISKMLGQMSINNEGAAQEMMKTWVGALSQLKTQWELTAKDIASAGFFDEIKAAVKEVSTGLNSVEFKRFALELGDDLGQIVKAGVSFVKTLYEMKDALLIGAGALLVMRINSGLLLPMVDALTAKQGGLRKVYEGFAQAAINRAQIVKDQQLAETRSVISGLEAQQRVHATVVDRRRVELANLERQAERHADNMAKIQRRLSVVPSATGAALTDPNFAQRAALKRALDEENTAYMRNRQAINLTSQAIASNSTSYQRLNTQIEQSNRQMRAMQATQVQLSGTAKALAGAKAMLGSAVAALGGPMGLLLIALQLGIMAWANWGRAAEEAAERAKRAARGISSSEDLVKAEANAKAQQIALEQSNAAVQRLQEQKASGDKRFNQFYLDQATEFNEKQKKLVKDAAAELQLIRANVDRQDRSDLAEMATRRVEDEIRNMKDADGKLIAAAQASLQNRLDALKGDPKKQEQARIAGMKEIQKLGIDASTREVAGFDAALQVYRQKLQTTEGQARGAILDTIQRLSEARDQAVGQLQLRKTTLDPINLVLKPDDPDKKTPIEKFIGNLQEQKAKLEAELNGFRTTVAQADSVAGAVAEVRAKFSSGDFQYGKSGDRKNASKAQVDQAALLAAEVERLSLAAKDADAFTKMMDDLAPRYEEAVRRLADPIGDDKDGKETNRVDKFLSSISPERLRAMAEKIGRTVDDIKGELTNKAGAIDSINFFEKMAEDTKSINASLVDDAREAGKKRQEVDNATYQNFARLLIERRRIQGASDQEIARLEKMLADNTVARAKDLAEKFKSPLDKLVAEWKNSTKNMEEASTGWANRTMDALMRMVEGGKAGFADLVKSILLDIARIQLQKSMADGIGAVLSAFTFADGGIMSGSGAVPLRKYAAGGIANSPQLAIFGEGDTEEAFVPLPDGRRIPVNLMGGGGSPNVVVNVINQTSQPVNASQGQPRFDGKQMVLDVVLGAAAQPGPFRDGMRQMMGK